MLRPSNGRVGSGSMPMWSSSVGSTSRFIAGSVYVLPRATTPGHSMMNGTRWPPS